MSSKYIFIIVLFWICLIFRNLKPVTQLYVSVDAATKDTLKKIDRPLFKDFWQRFLDSLTALSDKVRYLMLNLKQLHSAS